MAAVALVDIGALDLTTCEPFGALDDGGQGVAVIGVSRQRLGMQHELATGRAGITRFQPSIGADCESFAGGPGVAFGGSIVVSAVRLWPTALCEERCLPVFSNAR